jgi:hypothetical protein
MPVRLAGVLVIGASLMPSAVFAAGEEQSPQPRPPAQRPAPDFLFGRPTATVGVRGAWRFARAGSDWYDFVTDELTLERRDFDSPSLGIDFSVLLTPRIDAVFSMDLSQAREDSEYRRLVDNNRLPITQETRLREMNLGGAIRFALTERGRTISRFAWVPSSVVPYIGAGAGALWFSLEQKGDFVDFEDYHVFPEVFRSQGWAPSAHVLGGVDIQLHRWLFLTVDGRYVWASGDLGRDWIDFEPIDLGGAHLSTGITFLF